MFLNGLTFLVRARFLQDLVLLRTFTKFSMLLVMFSLKLIMITLYYLTCEDFYNNKSLECFIMNYSLRIAYFKLILRGLVTHISINCY